MIPRSDLEKTYFSLAHGHIDADSVNPRSLRTALVERLISSTPLGGVVVELGCGAGNPVAASIAASERHIVGVDTVFGRLQQAQATVAGGSFICASFLDVAFRPGSIDSMAAFHGLIHAPRARFIELIGSAVSWLRPGGLFVFSVGLGTSLWPLEAVPPSVTCLKAAEADTILSAAGFAIVDRQITDFSDDRGLVAFQWVAAVRS